MAELFSKFGEFDSYEELNMAAAGQLQEGDLEALKALAAENGIDPEDTEDYINGDMPELSTLMTACIGRLEIFQKQEIDNRKNSMERTICNVIMQMLRDMCTDQEMAKAVMHKGKRLSYIYDAMGKAAKRHSENNMAVSCGTDRQLQQIIRSYFCGTEQDLEHKLEDLYK